MQITDKYYLIVTMHDFISISNDLIALTLFISSACHVYDWRIWYYWRCSSFVESPILQAKWPLKVILTVAYASSGLVNESLIIIILYIFIIL